MCVYIIYVRLPPNTLCPQKTSPTFSIVTKNQLTDFFISFDRNILTQFTIK